MEEKENKINETEQKKSRMIQEQKEQHVGIRGDGCILPDYWKMFLPIVILFLIIGLIFRLTGM